jgi:hypothetical protein
LVGGGSASQGVVAATAEQQGGRQCAIGFIEREAITAGLAEGLDARGIGDSRVPAGNRDGATIDQDGASSIAADGNRIGQSIAKRTECAGGRQEGCEDGHCRSFGNDDGTLALARDRRV